MKNSYIYGKCINSERGRHYLECLKYHVDDFCRSGLADKHFTKELYGENRHTFYQRLWEMNLAHYLIINDFKIESRPIGPDFKTTINGKTVWIEAVSPTPEGIPDQNEEGVVYDFPHKETLLRVTSAIKSKHAKYLEYTSKAIVEDEDICIIAVDTGQLGISDRGISQQPYVLEATYPVGPYYISIGVDTLKQVGSGYSYRHHVLKNNATNINTDTFLSGSFPQISAIIGAHGGFQGIYSISLVHNLSAKNPLMRGAFRVDCEYVATYENDMLSIQNIS